MSISNLFSPNPASDETLPALTSQDVMQGCILFLGDEAETRRSYYERVGVMRDPVSNLRNEPPYSGMFGHPIVVISRPLSKPDTIYFHQMTSFAGKSLAERITGRKSAFKQQTFCPVSPAPDHPQLAATRGRYRTLTLENGDQLEKPSYVNVREVYEMNWQDAKRYWGPDSNVRKMWKLDRESIASLTRLSRSAAGFRMDAQFIPAQPSPVSRIRLNGSDTAELAPAKSPMLVVQFRSPGDYKPAPLWVMQPVPITRAISQGQEETEPLYPHHREKTSGDGDQSSICLQALLACFEKVAIRGLQLCHRE